MSNPKAIAVYRSLPGKTHPDVPGLSLDGALEESEHRRRLALSIEATAGVLLAQQPTSAQCSADLTVSSGSFVEVTGMSLEHRAPTAGEIAVTGSLAVEELTAGIFSIRIVNDSTVLWSVSIQEQASVLLSGSEAQLAKWLLPIGGPDLLTADANTSYNFSVEVAAPSGSYKVLTGNGTESWFQAKLNPTLSTS